MFILFGFFTACNTPEQSAKDQVIVVPKHSAPQEDDFKTFSFSCCSDPTAQKTIDSYVQLTDALANDDSKQSSKLGLSFLDLAIQHPSLKEESDLVRPLWTDMEGIRANLSDISLLVIDLAKKNQSNSGKTIIAAFCPMAPGRWLQQRNEIHNPYYGSKMLKCGVFE